MYLIFQQIISTCMFLCVCFSKNLFIFIQIGNISERSLIPSAARPQSAGGARAQRPTRGSKERNRNRKTDRSPTAPNSTSPSFPSRSRLLTFLGRVGRGRARARFLIRVVWLRSHISWLSNSDLKWRNRSDAMCPFLEGWVTLILLFVTFLIRFLRFRLSF